MIAAKTGLAKRKQYTVYTYVGAFFLRAGFGGGLGGILLALNAAILPPLSSLFGGVFVRLA